jgi:ABC-2 type transport system permease protein
MESPSAPSLLRVVWLIASLELRRSINRRPALWRRRSKSADELVPTTAQRAGTGRKGAPGKLLFVFVAIILSINVFTNSARVVHGVSSAAERAAAPDVVLISSEAMDGIDWVLSRGSPLSGIVPSELNRKDQLVRMFEYAAQDEAPRSRAETHARAEELTRIFEQRGRAGFRETTLEAVPWPSTKLWYHGGDPFVLLMPLGLVGFLLSLAMIALSVVGPDRDLARVESKLEWWFTFPVSVRGLLLARALETALIGPLLWLFAMPFFSVVFWSAGLGAWGVLLALLATLYLGVLAGSLRVLAETVLRSKLSLRTVAIVQAALQVLGSLAMVLAFTSISQVGLDYLIGVARTLPRWLLVNPLSLPLCWLLGWPRAALALGSALLFGLGMLYVSMAVGGAALRDGLTRSTGPQRGTRARKPGLARQAGARVSEGQRLTLLGAIAHKELLSITRDPGRVVRVLLLPLLMIAFQGLLNPAFFRAIVSNPGHASAASFGVGCLVLSSGALLSLANEGSALWLLSTAPWSLDRILLRKAMFWSALAIAFSTLTLIGLGLVTQRPALVVTPHSLLALVGVALYGFMAVALGALGTDALESELQKRMQPWTPQLFLLLSGLFAYALYTPSVWAKFVQLSLSALLAFALWQKVRDHTPYLLDPTESPPASLAVADGIIAALAFFVLQALLYLFCRQIGVAPGLCLLFGFVGAGLVVSLGALYAFARSGVPALRIALGLSRSSVGEARLGRGIAEGVVAGGIAGAIATLYTRALDHIDWLHDLYEESQRLDPSRELLPWLCVLAVFAAPLFEELIFRGVLYGGFRRSLSARSAALASSLVFALVHPPLSFVPVFVMALLAASVYERNKLLYAPIAAHMTYNTIVVGIALAQ